MNIKKTICSIIGHKKTVNGFPTTVCPRCGHVLIHLTDCPTDEDVKKRKMKLYPAVPGKALSPVVGRDFDEVFMCIKDGKEYYWSTAVRGFDSKNRNLPTSEKITIDWRLIFDKFNSLYKESSSVGNA